MSVHVLLNLLNELGEIDKRLGLPSIFKESIAFTQGVLLYICKRRNVIFYL